MEGTRPEEELKLLQDEFSSKEDLDLNLIDLSRLQEAFPSSDLIDKIVSSFKKAIVETKEPTKLASFDFQFKILQKFDERIWIVEKNGGKMVLKLEEYMKETDVSLHEFFVGHSLNQLNLPTFAKMLGTFGGSPPTNESLPCQFVPDDNETVNYVLYQYIEGKTINEMIFEKAIGLDEGFYLLELAYHSVCFAHCQLGFYHQDLHFGNIILQELKEPMSLEINGRSFVVRYLPKIIDFARAQIVIDKKIFSPTISLLSIPANSIEIDLKYLIFPFFQFVRRKIMLRENKTKELNEEFGKELEKFAGQFGKFIQKTSSKDLRNLYAKLKKQYGSFQLVSEKELVEDKEPLTFVEAKTKTKERSNGKFALATSFFLSYRRKERLFELISRYLRVSPANLDGLYSPLKDINANLEEYLSIIVKHRYADSSDDRIIIKEAMRRPELVTTKEMTENYQEFLKICRVEENKEILHFEVDFFQEKDKVLESIRQLPVQEKRISLFALVGDSIPDEFNLNEFLPLYFGIDKAISKRKDEFIVKFWFNEGSQLGYVEDGDFFVCSLPIQAKYSDTYDYYCKKTQKDFEIWTYY